jgi:ethanolamine permease
MFFMAAYLTALFGTPGSAQPIWWLVGYAVMIGLSTRGLALSMRFVVAITLAAIAILLFFFVAALPHVDFGRWALNIGVGPDGAAVQLPEGNGPWLPFGLTGVFLCLPFAIYMFLAIEQLPLTAEESHAPARDMPRALVLGIMTLVVLALGVLFLNTSLPNGAYALGKSGEPLLDGFRALFGDGAAKLLAGVAVVGLAASFFAGSFASGRNIYSLSRAGYFPTGLSVTHGEHRTPNIALIASSVIALSVLFLLWFLMDGDATAIGGTLVNMIVFSAMISYVMQSISYMRLKTLYPNIERPFKSPLGTTGAVLTIGISVVTLVFQFMDPAYRLGVVGVAIWYAVGLSYFAFYRRHRLVLSPEEEFAVTGGRRGQPAH